MTLVGLNRTTKNKQAQDQKGETLGNDRKAKFSPLKKTPVCAAITCRAKEVRQDRAPDFLWQSSSRLVQK